MNSGEDQDNENTTETGYDNADKGEENEDAEKQRESLETEPSTAEDNRVHDSGDVRPAPAMTPSKLSEHSVKLIQILQHKNAPSSEGNVYVFAMTLIMHEILLMLVYFTCNLSN